MTPLARTRNPTLITLVVAAALGGLLGCDDTSGEGNTPNQFEEPSLPAEVSPSPTDE